ncbi:hypothetical protein ABT369_26580 [Dactylosporangium sp. NPDC000244]|uniref:hypothetical protein n=1 Tax=Dactylosporangium sp. NPDC000244 TaxID=3154365 RepID=UPI00332D8B2F
MPGQPARDVFGPAHDWGRLRQWDGSQHRAFEELTFQLRDPAPSGWRTVKTGNPDGGLEWYDQATDGATHGGQAKFVADIDDLIPLARESLRTVGANMRFRRVVRMTFYAPFDMPDAAPVSSRGRSRRPARQRWDEALQRWQSELPGVAGIDVQFIGGGQLLERLTRPGNEGRRWFFFGERALGRDWCDQRWRIAERTAQERYTPDRHVALPTSQVLGGVVLSEQFLQRLRDRVRAAHDQVCDLVRSWQSWLMRHSSTHATSALHTAVGEACEDAEVLVRTLEQGVAQCGITAELATTELCRNAADLGGVLEGLLDRIQRLADALDSGSSTDPAHDQRAKVPADQQETDVLGAPQKQTPSDALAGLLKDGGVWWRAARATDDLLQSLRSDEARAAEAGAWLMIGPPGQGKTHLLLDGARRALDQGRLAVVILGEELKGEDPLTEISRRLGLGDLGHDVLLQAMEAAGAASSARFLMIVDAINDSDVAARWKVELPGLLARVAQYPHVAVVVSCRDTVRDVVLPDLRTLDLPVTEHPGFDGVEVEALEQYLRNVPHALPRTPLLLPAFSNPLFVKLYAEGLRARAARSTKPVTVSGSQHRSEVFELFLDTRAEIICDQLRIDRAGRPVHRAVSALATRMADNGRDVLDRDEARVIVDAYAPGKTEWPDTMLGKLVSHGILAADRYYVPDADPRLGVAFSYQAFSDDQIVRAILDRYASDVDALTADGRLPEDSLLRRWLQDAAPGLQEAATVLLPERTGVELIDVLDVSVDPTRPYGLFRGLCDTLPLRAADGVTARTVALVEHGLASPGLDRAAMRSILAVTTEPDHPLNADWLHTRLLTMERTVRDVWWAPRIYDTLSEHGPLHRLVRWAEQLPTPRRLSPDAADRRNSRVRAHRAGILTSDAVDPEPDEPPAEVVQLAATTLIWTLTSSNRFLRDRATKALVQLLLGHPDVLSMLINRFLGEDARRIDDPYLFERLALTTYGVVMRAGARYPTAVEQLASQLLTHVYSDPKHPAHASRNTLLCDAARGVITSAVNLGVLSREQATAAAHPHAAETVETPPTEDDVEARFPSTDDIQTSWGRITLSLHKQGDFGNYVVRPTVRKISRLPIQRSRPDPRAERRLRTVQLSPDAVRAFQTSLPIAAQNAATPASIERLLRSDWIARDVLSREQYELLKACPVPQPHDEVLFDAHQDVGSASRWIVARVASLGWSPHQFGVFDSIHGHRGRDAHKSERIGKKYQWLALHELGERLINHYHVNGLDNAAEPDLVAAWQRDQRDLDPSLPPAPHPMHLDEDQGPDPADHRATFPLAEPEGFWLPPQPELPDVHAVDDWITGTESIPPLEDTAERHDEQRTPWVVLSEYASDTTDGLGFRGQTGQADQSYSIDSWLVAADHAELAFDFLRKRTLFDARMPDASHTYRRYLGELPKPDSDGRNVDDIDSELRFVNYDATPQSVVDYDDAPQAEGQRPRAVGHRVAKLVRSDLEQDAKLIGLAQLWSGETGEEHAGAASDAEVDDFDPISQLYGLVLDRANNDANDSTDDLVYFCRDAHGAPVRLIPATQEYVGEAVTTDCSLDVTVNVTLPSDVLLNGADLTQHPDRTDWYDVSGQCVATHRRTRRPTGTINTLLVRTDWLDERLRSTGFGLLVGMKANRQPTATDTLRHWAELSQTAVRTAEGSWRYGDVHRDVKNAAQ